MRFTEQIALGNNTEFDYIGTYRTSFEDFCMHCSFN